MSTKKKKKTKTTTDPLMAVASEFIETEQELKDLAEGKRQAWPTGCDTLEIISTIGGLPATSLVEIYGKPSSGKSLLLYSTAAQVQARGKTVVLMDYERLFDPQWGRQLGMNVDDPNLFMHIKSQKLRTLEQGLDILYKLIEADKNGQIGLIIWDSLANATPKAVADKKSVEDSAQMLRKSAILSEELPKLVEKLESSNSQATVGFVNQIRSNPNAQGFGSNETTPGGNAFEHNAAMRIQVKHVGFINKTVTNPFTLESNSDKIGQKVQFTMTKNKFGSRGRTGDAVFIFQHGYDNQWKMVEWAMARGDFEKVSAQKYRVPGKFTADGKPVEGVEATLRKFFHEDPESWEILRAYLREDIERVYWDNVSKYSFSQSATPQQGKTMDLGSEA